MCQIFPLIKSVVEPQIVENNSKLYSINGVVFVCDHILQKFFLEGASLR